MTEEIINQIKRNLSGNPDLDRDYLVSQLDYYKNHESAYEIIKEISGLIWQSLDFYHEENNEESKKTNVSRILDDVIPLIENRDKKTALEKLENFMSHFEDKYENEEIHKESDFKSNRSITEIQYMRYELNKLSRSPKSYNINQKKSNRVNWRKDVKINKMNKDNEEEISVQKEYHSFLNPLEEILFYQYIGLEKELAYIPFNEPLFDLYYIYGTLLLENDDFAKAEEYLLKALRINPVSSKTILSLADIYKSKTRTYNRFFLYNVDALKFAYKNEDIARAYRNFGFFYVEENQLDIAAVFYDFSLNFDFNRQAFRELEYLKSRGINTEIDRKDAENVIESKKIQVGVNPFILDTLRIICVDLEIRKYYRGALYFYRILYDLTKDNHILGKINSIQNRI
ncbi:tetratricopeptide repeat protein [Methanobrevibacter sp.]|uniref:tetratricopeptide repeat protein n=1 Tax=Methanobrevibacter sp. TaxID=66852 RepID=UPI00386D6FBC